MDNKNIFVVLAIFFSLFSTSVSFGEGLKIGTKAPSFEIKSGDDETLTFDMIKGKVIIMFYLTKDVVEKNRRLQNELNKFYSEQPDSIKKDIVRLAIVNCSGAFWPLTGIWKNELRENSKKEGITIYGDWDGKMFSDYKMKDKESNVVIIDKKGTIRYFASGKVEDKEIDEIKELLKEIGNEK